MPQLFIRTINADFDSRDEGASYDEPAAALRRAVQGGISIAGEEIARGRITSAIEVRIEQEDGVPVLRSVVAVSVSPLMLSGDAAHADAR